MNGTESNSIDEPAVATVLDRVRSHDFHPVDETSFTIDRSLETEGIADPDDDDWRVRLLAVRDLVRLGDAAATEIAAGLQDEDVQVRYVSATALGVLRAGSAIEELERVAREDPKALARSQATDSGRSSPKPTRTGYAVSRRSSTTGTVLGGQFHLHS